MALCCVAHTFSATTDFAIDKDYGVPCPNLAVDDRCTIHGELREHGFPGCVAYDCYGAGQYVTQVMFAGRHWRTEPDGGLAIFDAFNTARELHEHLWHLREAITFEGAADMRDELRSVAGEVEAAIGALPEEPDRSALRKVVGDALHRASELTRGGTPPGLNFANKVLIGQDFRGADLRRAVFAGACLIGSDFTGADLDLADLAGADLRGVDFSGVDLRRCLFVTPAQLTAAATPLPAPQTRRR